MPKNMGSVDRIVRGVIAVALVVVAAIAGFGSVVGVIALVLAVVMVATATVGTCPLYRPFRIDTRRR